MNRLLQLFERYSTPLLSALFLLVVAIIFYTRGIETEQHLNTVALIDEIEETEKNYNIALLNTQLFIKSNLDTLLTSERSYKTLLQALDDSDLGLKPEYSAPFQQQLNTVVERVKQKSKLVDRYKTNRTVHNNSLIYLPLVSQKLESFNLADRSNEVMATHVLFEEVLIHLGNQDHNSKQTLLSAITTLQQQIQQQQNSHNNKLAEADRALQHLYIVITSFSAMNESLKQALSIDLAHEIHQLHEIYLDGYKDSQQQNRLGNQILWVISFILFVGIIRTLRRVREQYKELQQLGAAVDQHAIVSTADLYGNITHANDKFCEISGYQREELLGQNHRLVKSDRHPPAFYRELWETISSGKVWQGEVWNRNKDGESHYCVFGTIVPFSDIHGNITKYVSIRTNLTQLKQSEQELKESQEKFQGLVEDIGEGYVIFSADPESYLLRYVSPEFEPLFGLSSETALNHSLVESIHWSEEARRQLEQCMTHTLEHGRSAPFEISFTHASSGEQHTVSITQHQVEKEGRVVAVEGIIQDITERLQAEKRQFEAFQAGVSEMSASVLHSIGNIITGLTGSVQGVEKRTETLQKLSRTINRAVEKHQQGEIKSEEMEKLLTLIETSIGKTIHGVSSKDMGINNHIGRLKEGLQDIKTSINAYRGVSQQGADNQTLSLRKLSADALQLVHSTLEQEGIVTTIGIPADLEVEAPINQSLQLLVNLINNSAQAILQRRKTDPAHGGTIVLNATRNEQMETLLTITDDGCGIEQEQLSKLFNHGYTTKADGSGFGLHTAGNLMNKLGGTITINSDGHNRGASVTLTYCG